MKEYIVALKEGVNYAQVWDDIENLSPGLPHIPERAIGIADNLDALDRVTHYYLTDAEAEEIRQDPRVLGVEIPAEHRPEIGIALNSIQQNVFTKTSLSTGDYVNWGLVRNSNATNVYGNSTTTNSNYNYTVDGSNVDVVIVDSGIQANHPEFQYAGNSTSRLQQYVWYAGLDPATYYTDTNGHGTHVAGIAAGKTYGWAKNANIYALKYSGLTMSQIANYIITWHNAKSVNPVTGVKNPSIVNMSFGYILPLNQSTQPGYSVYYNIANVTYQGGSTVNSPGYGSSSPYGLVFGQDIIPYWNETYNTPIVQMTDAGIVVCKSAGNDSQKVALPGTTDWNNYVWLTYQANAVPAGTAFYMRGGSPSSSTESVRGNAIIVGALDSTTYSSTLDKKASYSMAGPGVDIFAAGSNIMSSCSNVEALPQTPGDYYWNTSFKQINISGTSMSSPQVAGIAALIAQANPTATPAQVKNRLLTVATTTMIGNVATNPSGTDYGNTVSQWGGNAGVAYMTYNSVNPLIIVGSN